MSIPYENLLREVISTIPRRFRDIYEQSYYDSENLTFDIDRQKEIFMNLLQSFNGAVKYTINNINNRSSDIISSSDLKTLQSKIILLARKWDFDIAKNIDTKTLQDITANLQRLKAYNKSEKINEVVKDVVKDLDKLQKKQDLTIPAYKKLLDLARKLGVDSRFNINLPDFKQNDAFEKAENISIFFQNILNQFMQDFGETITKTNSLEINDIIEELQAYLEPRGIQLNYYPLRELNRRYLDSNKYYSESIKKIKNTLNYIQQNSRKAAFRYASPIPFVDLSYGEKPVFELICFLKMIGQDEQVEKLTSHFQNDSREELEEWMKKIYQIYDDLISQLTLYRKTLNENKNTMEEIEKQEANNKDIKKLLELKENNQDLLNSMAAIKSNLKTLKHLIHQVADTYSLEKELFNRHKLSRKIDAFNHLDILMTSAKYNRLANHANQLSYKKKLAQKKKKNLNLLGSMVSVIIGIGEGMVAAVLLGSLGLAALGVGCAGFLINYLLFKSASQGALKDFFARSFMKRIYRDKYNNPISQTKKILISISLVSVVASALGFGLLSFGTATKALAALFTAAAVCPPLTVITAIAVTIAAITTLGTIFLNYCANANVIKQNIFSKMAQFFKEEFADRCKEIKDAIGTSRNKLGRWDTTKLVAKNVGMIVLNTLYVASCAAFIVTFLTGTTGFFHGKVQDYLTSVWNISDKVASYINYAFNDGLSTLLNSTLYSTGIVSVFSSIKNFILDPITPIKNAGRAIVSFFNDRFQGVVSLIKNVNNALFSTCAVANAVGQSGAGSDPSAIAYTATILPLAPDAIAKINEGCTGAASFTLNNTAINDEFKTPDVIIEPEKNNQASRENTEDQIIINQETKQQAVPKLTYCSMFNNAHYKLPTVPRAASPNNTSDPLRPPGNLAQR